jgi:cysteine desulfurase
VPDAVAVGRAAPRLPNTSALAMPGVDAATQVMAFDLAGIAVSAGAACSSGRVKPSHVLAAMGLPPEIAGSTIRVSLGWTTTEAELDRFAEEWLRLWARLGASRAAVSAA